MKDEQSDDIPNIYHIHRPASRTVKRILHVIDTLVALLIVAPLVVLHWRGTWTFMDNHPEYFPPWNSFLFGGMLHTIFVLVREYLHTEFSVSSDGKKSLFRTIYRHISTKLYTYMFSIGSIMHWRGGWAVLEILQGTSEVSALLTSAACLIGLVMLKSVRNLAAPPIVILTDSKEFVFSFPTRFRVKGQNEPGLYVLDCLFSVLVIGTLVVFVWRGFWVFLDLQLFPGNDRENHIKSAWGSTVIGYGIVAVTFALQPFMRAACDRLEGIWRVAAADIFLILSFIGTVNVWRGVWKLIDLFFMPDDWLLNNLITHAVGFILLALLNCSNSVLVRGVYIDAEEPAGQCVVFPIYYIRFFFQKERTKKQRKLLEALDSAAADANTELLTKKNSTNANNSTPITLVASKNLINVSNMSKEMTFTEITESSEKLSKIEYDNEKKSDEDYDS